MNFGSHLTTWIVGEKCLTFFVIRQTGIGKGGGLNELKVQNKAGNYVASTIGSGSFIQALPRVTPPSSASWHGVSLVYQIGVETYPIVSFLYTFYHVKYSAQTPLVKAFGRFTLVRFMSEWRSMNRANGYTNGYWCMLYRNITEFRYFVLCLYELISYNFSHLFFSNMQTSAGQGLNSAQYFYQVPSQYTRKSLRAIRKIK